MKGNEINIIVTGDFCPHGRVEKLCLNGNYDNIYGDFLDILRDKDISITNLECPLISRPNPITKCGPNLSASPQCIKGIKHAQFDVVALANNHIMDHGQSGLESTLLASKEAEIKTVGVGSNLESAAKILYLTVKNSTIAILNFAEHEFSIATSKSAGANPLDPVQNYYQVQQAKQNADIVLVIVHGGHQKYPLPSPRMVQTYRYFVDLGANAVIGHHTHCVSGYEIYNNVPIFYSLGNFIFDGDGRDNNWYEGYFVKFSISNGIVKNIKLHPYTQCRNSAGIYPMTQQRKEQFLKDVNKYCDIIKNSDLNEQEWQNFCESHERGYLAALLSKGRVARRLLKFELFRNMILKKNRLPCFLGIIRCEAHRDIAVRILEQIIAEK